MNKEYDIIIEEGKSELNDLIIEKITRKIPKAPNHKYLDVGCNTGWLLEKVPGGSGVDNSEFLLNKARKKGLKVSYGDISTRLPFDDSTFDTVVLSCVLQQTEDPMDAISEALRVSKRRIIGVAPYPGRSEWGRVGGNEWTKSALWPNRLQDIFDATIEPIEDDPEKPTHYYFQIEFQKQSKKMNLPPVYHMRKSVRNRG